MSESEGIVVSRELQLSYNKLSWKAASVVVVLLDG